MGMFFIWLLWPPEPLYSPAATGQFANLDVLIFILCLGDVSVAKQEKARPVHNIRMGRIKAALWENETANRPRHNVTVSRIYKEGDTWKDSNSFGRDDLPPVGKVIELAHTWIFDSNGS